ncbi:MAG TPA: hypothetical protein VII94_03450 [Candidatus Saccharimonadales bacterium]
MLNAKQLDAQSVTFLDGWVDLDSTSWKEVDDNPSFTRRCIKIGMDSNYLVTDNFGRLWGMGENKLYYPFHLEYGSKKFGIRLPKKAAN